MSELQKETLEASKLESGETLTPTKKPSNPTLKERLNNTFMANAAASTAFAIKDRERTNRELDILSRQTTDKTWGDGTYDKAANAADEEGEDMQIYANNGDVINVVDPPADKPEALPATLTATPTLGQKLLPLAAAGALAATGVGLPVAYGISQLPAIINSLQPAAQPTLPAPEREPANVSPFTDTDTNSSYFLDFDD